MGSYQQQVFNWRCGLLLKFYIKTNQKYEK